MTNYLSIVFIEETNSKILFLIPLLSNIPPVCAKVVKDLQNRLNSTRLDHSKNYNSLQKIVDYWKYDYDFQTRERYINKYMHFTTNIEGLDIQFIHVKPTSYGQNRILPLLMLHGWPSSVLEFYKFIPLLITPRKDYDFVFEVIVPSLPGFGYFAAPTLEDFSCTDMCMILINLMLRVGHNQFYVQGSDWNVFIARNMSELFSEHVLGIYTSISAPLNKDINLLYSSLAQQLNKQEISKLKPNEEFLQNQTLAIESSLNSPADLAAYFVDIFLTATNYSDINEEFLQKYSLDYLVDNLMIYWASKRITTAMRIFDNQYIELKSEFLEELRKKGVPFASLFLGNIPKIRSNEEETNSTLLNWVPNLYTLRSTRFPAHNECHQFADNIWVVTYGIKMLNKYNTDWHNLDAFSYIICKNFYM